MHVVNQHGSMGEESEAMLQALQCTVLVVPSWVPSHPAPDVLKRIMNSRTRPSPRYVFATDLRDAARIVIGQRATPLGARRSASGPGRRPLSGLRAGQPRCAGCRGRGEGPFFNTR